MCHILYISCLSCGCKIFVKPPFYCSDFYERYPRKPNYLPTLAIRDPDFGDDDFIEGSHRYQKLAEQGEDMLPWFDCHQKIYQEESVCENCPYHMAKAIDAQAEESTAPEREILGTEKERFLMRLKRKAKILDTMLYGNDWGSYVPARFEHATTDSSHPETPKSQFTVKAKGESSATPKSECAETLESP